MERICKSALYLGTRLHNLCNLVFFVVIFSACSNSQNRGEISIIREGGRAVAIFIPSDSIPGVNEDKLEQDVLIRMAGSSENMLGEYSMDNSGLFFRPLVELQPGGNYQVVFKGRVLSTLRAPSKDTGLRASVNAIYPSADTLPENLLKVYLLFSDPMRQGVSEKYLALLDGKNDTIHNAFLNLTTELWDQEGRQLTLWFDPGRIKRGLQPNEKVGAPLASGHFYTLSISPDWTDLKGNKLDKRYSKRFITTPKDTQSPDPSLWKINPPASRSRQPITIALNEPLDYSLLNNTISIIRRDGEAIKGKISIRNNERSILFHPENQWSAGIYYLKIDSRLEDLAGNNLNRLFDRDLLTDKPAGKEEFFTKQFRIN